MADEDDEDRSGKPDRGFRPQLDFSNKREGARSFVATPEGAFIHEHGKWRTLADAVDVFWVEIARDPAAWSRDDKGLRWLMDNADDASREDVRRTLNWVEVAIRRRDRDALAAAARYLNAMPSPLLAADYGRLMTIFNSRIVGMVWQVTPDLDVTPLPPAVPKFGREAGLGLIRSVPEFYIKISNLSPEMEEIVSHLAAEAVRYGISLPDELAAMVPSPSAKE